jgi:transposase
VGSIKNRQNCPALPKYTQYNYLFWLAVRGVFIPINLVLVPSNPLHFSWTKTDKPFSLLGWRTIFSRWILTHVRFFATILRIVATIPFVLRRFVRFCLDLSHPPHRTLRAVLSRFSRGEQWELIAHLFPEAKPGGRPRSVSIYAIMNAILYVLCQGCTWRGLPGDFPAWSTVYGYFRRWQKDGTWLVVHDKLYQWVRVATGREPSLSRVGN